MISNTKHFFLYLSVCLSGRTKCVHCHLDVSVNKSRNLKIATFLEKWSTRWAYSSLTNDHYQCHEVALPVNSTPCSIMLHSWIFFHQPPVSWSCDLDQRSFQWATSKNHCVGSCVNSTQPSEKLRRWWTEYNNNWRMGLTNGVSRGSEKGCCGRGQSEDTGVQ